MKQALLTILLTLLHLMASADAVEINGIYYNLISKVKEAEVTSNPNYYSGSIVIPDRITYEGKEYSVTSIGDMAFYNCVDITSIVIPFSVTSIKSSSFDGCKNISSIILPSNVTTLGSYAFNNCKSLKTISMPSNLEFIGRNAFLKCSELNKVIIDNIGGWCGVSFEDLESNPLFYSHHIYSDEYTEIKDLIIPNGVTCVNENAFYNCSDILSVTIPNSIEEFKKGAFNGCSSLDKIMIEDLESWLNIISDLSSDPISYASHIYLNNVELINLVIPDNISSISPNKFYGCSSLKSISFPVNLTEIGTSAFEGCSGLTTLSLPSELTCIGNFAFYGCTGLTEVTVPNRTTSIGDLAFAFCNGLQSVTIGSNISYIGNMSFSRCPELLDFYCLASKVPNTGTDLFKESYIDHSTLHVPAAAISAYSGVDPWKNFKNIVKIDMPTYTLKYVVDGNIYKEYQVEEGSPITPEAEPAKEGYTFSGWSEIPTTMPANDVTVTGTFTKGAYKLTYIVDGEVYKTISYDYGATITPETAPTKEGYTFSGWSEIPSTMPAHDVTVTGTFTHVVFNIDGVTYEITGNGEVTIIGGDEKGEVTIESTIKINGQTYQVTGIADNAFKNNQDITSLTIPEGITTIGDNAFNGCTGLIVINIGKDVQTIGDRAFANIGTAAGVRTRSEASMIIVNCYTESVPQTASNAFENTPIETGTLFVEDNLKDAFKSTSPWSRFGNIIGFKEAAGINSITIGTEDTWIFDMQGNRLDNTRKGVNIIRTRDGKTKKVMVK